MPEQQKGDRKTYFVDDEVLRYDSKAPERLSQGNRVRIPLYILRRIEDRSKMARSEEEAVVARQISQCLAPYENCGLLGKGAASKSGGIITVTSGFHLTRKSKHSQREADLPNNIGLDADTRIIHEALAWKKAHPHETVVLVSRNFFLRLTAQSCGLAAEDYRHDRIGSLDPGTAEIELADGDVSDIFNLMQRKPECAVDADVVLRAATQKVSLVPNQFCKISRRSFKKPQGDTMFCIYKAGESPLLRLVEKLAQTKTRFIVPRNLEQRFLYKALLDAEIRIVAAGGPAGTGKTVCAMQAGYELLRQDLFDQILVVRPHTDVGEPLGFLPGTVDEKIEPWKTPIIRALGKILPIMPNGDDSVRINGVLVSKAVQNLLTEGLVQILPTNFVQGDTFERSFVIIDEAQNMKSEDMEMLLTRLGEGSRCVITGSMRQVHNPKIKQLASGLVDAIERLSGTEIFSYVGLNKVERDPAVQLIVDRYMQ